VPQVTELFTALEPGQASGCQRPPALRSVPHHPAGVAAPQALAAVPEGVAGVEMAQRMAVSSGQRATLQSRSTGAVQSGQRVVSLEQPLTVKAWAGQSAAGGRDWGEPQAGQKGSDNMRNGAGVQIQLLRGELQLALASNPFTPLVGAGSRAWLLVNALADALVVVLVGIWDF
jgi:hypothetical protein